MLEFKRDGTLARVDKNASNPDESNWRISDSGNIEIVHKDGRTVTEIFSAVQTDDGLFAIGKHLRGDLPLVLWFNIKPPK
jgi:hypothetical protein